MNHRTMPHPLWISLGALAVFLLVPCAAWAWGPVAHMDFAGEIVRHAGWLASPIRGLVTHFPNDFLYGAIAADIIVGKNTAEARDHCHRWANGFRLFHEADTDARRAMALGFISHLGADIVAHNYFIPFKMMKNLRSKYFAHIYWEVKFDSFLDPSHYALANRLSAAGVERHDAYLNERLVMPLLPFSVNKRIFNGVLINQRFGSWHRLGDRFRSYSVLNRQDVELYKNVALMGIRDILNHLERSVFAANDATGLANLAFASTFRSVLQRRIDRGEIQPGAVAATLHRAREDLIVHLAEARPVWELLVEFGGPEHARGLDRRGRLKSVNGEVAVV